MEYSNNLFRTENLILLGSSGFQKHRAETIVSELKLCFPERFEGERDYVPFELRYVAPFDKSFNELKRLQGIAAEAAGRRDEFRGYIIIDLSNYLAHHKEAYFEIALHFLVDMNDYWKYIFLVDNANAKESKELVCHVLKVFLKDTFCEVIDEGIKPSENVLLNDICKEQNIVCSPAARALLREILIEGILSHDIVAGLLRDIAAHRGDRIDEEMLISAVTKKESAFEYLVNPKEFERLLDIIERRKEVLHGGKEAV